MADTALLSLRLISRQFNRWLLLVVKGIAWVAIMLSYTPGNFFEDDSSFVEKLIPTEF